MPDKSQNVEWTPHWLSAEIRDHCAATDTSSNMFDGSWDWIWDYTDILPDTPHTVTGGMDMKPFWLTGFAGGHGYTIVQRQER